MKLSHEIFESLSSDVDWCEPNYIHSSHIAEMWNTVSSLSLVLTSLVLMYLYQEYATKVPNCCHVNFVWFLLLVVGIGSIYFHATLSLFGQFLDELGILWVCLAAVAFWWPNEFMIKSMRNNRSGHHLLMAFIGVVTTCLCFIKPEVNHVLLFIFAIPAVGMMIYQMQRHKGNQEFQSVARSGTSSFLIAFSFWLLDRGLCQFWLNVHFPYLHGFWHLMISRASYKCCVAFSYCYALKESSSCLPYLKYQHLPLSKNLGLWCVGFQPKRNEEDFKQESWY